MQITLQRPYAGCGGRRPIARLGEDEAALPSLLGKGFNRGERRDRGARQKSRLRAGSTGYSHTNASDRVVKTKQEILRDLCALCG